MKKIFFLIIFLCFVLSACRETSVKVKHVDYPYAVIQGHRLIAFQLDEDGGISGKEEVRLPTEEAGNIQMRDLLEMSDAYYATTSSGKSNENIIKISKKRLDGDYQAYQVPRNGAGCQGRCHLCSEYHGWFV